MLDQLFSVSEGDDGVYVLNGPSGEIERDECTFRTPAYKSKRAMVKLGPDSPAKEQTVWFQTHGDLEFAYITAKAASEGLV